jgi:hypothetical protein
VEDASCRQQLLGGVRNTERITVGPACLRSNPISWAGVSRLLGSVEVVSPILLTMIFPYRNTSRIMKAALPIGTETQ